MKGSLPDVNPEDDQSSQPSNTRITMNYNNPMKLRPTVIAARILCQHIYREAELRRQVASSLDFKRVVNQTSAADQEKL
jgi:hypothetical protein